MFKELSEQLYGYIVSAEMAFLEIYKVNPWEIMKNMPLSDLQFYMKRIEEEQKTKQKNFKKKDIMEILKHVNEVLTWMFHKK